MSAKPPSPRWGHFSAAVGDQLYVWGGKTENFHSEENTLSSVLHSFHQVLESWERCECSGLPPPALFRSACISAEGHLYQYGGYNESEYQGNLYQLDTKSKEWKQLSNGGGPMRKDGCGMVAYGKKLVLFGGYGVPSGPIQPGALFFNNPPDTGRGWTNELHIFDLEEGGCMHACIHVCLYAFSFSGRATGLVNSHFSLVSSYIANCFVASVLPLILLPITSEPM